MIRASEQRVRRLVTQIAQPLRAGRFPRAVVLALDKLGVDLHAFRWKLVTGRFAKDYEIMLLLGARNTSAGAQMVSKYMTLDQRSLSPLSIRELKEKRYLDTGAIRKARKIMGLMSKPLIGG